ncbi:MAG: hypothetical protein SCH98_02070 [Deferrisomatales bacterium]|nr:hypothetical protein [Deferrisomatales bacterium]
MALCPICREETESLVHEVAERWLLQRIRDGHPGWVEADGACHRCWEHYQALGSVVRWEGGERE